VTLDATDKTLLRNLQLDGRLTNSKLAEKAAVSETACWRRLRRLEEEGYIAGYEARVDRRMLGYGVYAFVQLHVSSHSEEATLAFERTIIACPEVLSCHNVTGQADFLLQVVATDLDAYGRFVDRVLRKIPMIVSIQSSLSLRELKNTAQLPILA